MVQLVLKQCQSKESMVLCKLRRYKQLQYLLNKLFSCCTEIAQHFVAFENSTVWLS